jgi:hypothetical protein
LLLILWQLHQGSLGFTSPSSTGGEVALLIFRVAEFSKVSTQLSKTTEFLGIYITAREGKYYTYG